MARITGIDDGDEEPVLDLTVKKGMKKDGLEILLQGMVARIGMKGSNDQPL